MISSAATRSFMGAGVLVICLLVASSSADAGQTLNSIKKRGILRCGVSEGVTGFSKPDTTGRWSGLDAEFCRAVAAAVLGNGERVVFVPLKASERFPALKSGTIDILLRQTTWTFEREAGLKMNFPGVLYYDGQGFLVPPKSRITEIAGLKRKTICIVKGTTHVSNIAAYFAERRWPYQPSVIDSLAEAAKAFYTGRCDAFASDVSTLASVRLNAPGSPKGYRILPGRISEEPLGPVVRQGDDEWTSIVRWVLFLLIAAEEHGITQDNVRTRISKDNEMAVSRAITHSLPTAKALGMRADWAVKVIETVGNYEELFERTVGKKSPLGLEREYNKIWRNGGLLYAPPLR